MPSFIEKALSILRRHRRPFGSRRWRRVLWWFGLAANGLALVASLLGLTFPPFLLGNTVIESQIAYNAIFTLGGVSWIACFVIWLARFQTTDSVQERTASGVAGGLAAPILIACLIFGLGNFLSADSYQVYRVGSDGCRLVTETPSYGPTLDYHVCQGSPVLHPDDGQ